MRRVGSRLPLAAAAVLALASVAPSVALAAEPIAPVRPIANDAPAARPLGVTPPTVAPVAAPSVAAPAAPKAAPRAVAGAPRLPATASQEIKDLDARARGGEVEAQVELAEYFASGSKPDAEDARRAVFWYRQAAERGDADAAWALASLYRTLGEIVPGARSDMDEAVVWYRRAAEQGHAEAMFDLGLLYSEGEGVPRDPMIAAGWFEQAADAGVARALFMLGTLFEQGVDGAPDLETASAWYSRAAEAGDATGAAAVKRLAEGGRNVVVAEMPTGGADGPTAAAATTRPSQAAKADAPPKRTAKAANVPVDQAGVREIQARLQALGYKVGKPDGHLGKRTAAAIRAYQKAQKLPVDGRATRALLDHLRARG